MARLENIKTENSAWYSLGGSMWESFSFDQALPKENQTPHIIAPTEVMTIQCKRREGCNRAYSTVVGRIALPLMYSLE